MKISFEFNSDNLDEIHKALDLVNMLKYRHPDFKIEPNKKKASKFIAESSAAYPIDDAPVELKYKESKFGDNSPNPY
jgi:hypothetical protein